MPVAIRLVRYYSFASSARKTIRTNLSSPTETIEGKGKYQDHFLIAFPLDGTLFSDNSPVIEDGNSQAASFHGERKEINALLNGLGYVTPSEPIQETRQVVQSPAH